MLWRFFQKNFFTFASQKIVYSEQGWFRRRVKRLSPVHYPDDIKKI